MADLRADLDVRLEEETKYQHECYAKQADRMTQLEAMLDKEREERVISLDEQLEPINENIDKLYDELDVERNARV